MPPTDRETIATYTTEEEARAAAEDLRAEGHDTAVQRVADDAFEVSVPRDQASAAEADAVERTEHDVRTHT